jgi:hypothetical protein
VSSLAALVAALVAAAAPSHAAPTPPVFFTGQNVGLAQLRVQPATGRRTRSCTVRRQHAQAQAGRIERAMEPVACEQPPRSQVILTFSGGLFGNGR